ncbi:hypothetical protein GY45DRAFT_1098474 [Cubamyces sp. BRFM 1775]|nr:hypothetical protein GY45DRAFT_1098474 [Cubamyces sp. BRFM 1775]
MISLAKIARSGAKTRFHVTGLASDTTDSLQTPYTHGSASSQIPTGSARTKATRQSQNATLEHRRSSLWVTRDIMWPYYKESLVHRYVLVKTALINDGSDACGLRTLAAHCGVCEAVCRKPYDVLYQKGTTSRV